MGAQHELHRVGVFPASDASTCVAAFAACGSTNAKAATQGARIR